MAAILIALLSALGYYAFLQPVSSAYPFQNTTLPWKERVDDLVGRLTLHEMVLQMARSSPAPSIDRLGIKPYVWNSECLHGAVSPTGLDTAFPQAIGLGATFSPELLERVAKAIAYEVRARSNDYTKRGIYEQHTGLSCFSPVINIARHPLWGRNQETYGEDPFLTGELAKSYVRGLQGNHPRYLIANAGCKHFDVHGGPENIPSSRFSFDAKVSEQDWRMTFLPAFEECVKEGAYSVMCSYNRINGVPACGNKKLLTDILRSEWGFHGYVVSDEGAIEFIEAAHRYTEDSIATVALAVNAGCNLELAFPVGKPYYDMIEVAVEQGRITKETVIERVKPLFYTRMRLGEFDPPEMNPFSALNMSIVQSPEHRDLAIMTAVKSFVLLKNDGEILPFRSEIRNLAVVGPFADNPSTLFGDYAPDPDRQFAVTPCKGLRPLAADTKCTPGCLTAPCTQYLPSMVKAAVSGADLVVVALGTGTNVEAEFKDRYDLTLPGKQLQLLKDAVRYADGKPVILVLFNAGPLDVSWAENSKDVPVIIECFFPAQATGTALYKIFINMQGANPAGRLPMTWPKSMEQVKPMEDYSMSGKTYRYFEDEPLYPFGYGLSYSRFMYSNITVMPRTVQPCDNVSVSVTVQNIGKLAGDEVVQCYMSWGDQKHSVPKLQLVGFNRTEIQPGPTITVKFTIVPRMMAVYTDQWMLLSGKYTVYVGGQQPMTKKSVPSPVLSAKFTLEDSAPLSKCSHPG
ncbi:uncharacterized protein [Ptychodera flava]|uniref:uncharacterized protein n=1 Tax=Ptychodera flava TaxID=63121 RepID=UPI003969C7D8